MRTIILVAVILTGLFGVSTTHPSGSLAVARIVDQAKPYNAVQSKSTAISVAGLSIDEVLWCHGAGLPADLTSLMEMTSTLKDTDDYYNWLLCYYSVKVDDLQHSVATPATSFEPGLISPRLEHYTGDKRIAARNVDTDSTVTVTVTTIPDYCTSTTPVTVAGVSTGSVIAPTSTTASAPATAAAASGTISSPSTANVPVPAAPASGTTSSPGTAVVPVAASANATGAAPTPATAENTTGTAGSTPSNFTAGAASNNSTLTSLTSGSSSKATSKTSAPSTSISIAATSSTQAPTSGANSQTQLPILVTVLIALAGGIFCIAQL